MWTDIRDLDKKLGQRKFDNLGYSNILSWIEPYEVGPILDQTKKHINPGGRLFLVAGETQFDDIIDVVADFYPQPEWKIEPIPEVGLFRQIIVQNMQSTK